MTKFFALLLFLLLLPLGVVHAQVTDSTIALPSITVTATRIPVAITNSPVRTQILNDRELEESTSSTVASILGQRTTLYVRSYGGMLSSLSQRGSTASQVLVLLDGTPMGSPTAGQLDLSLLPLSLMNSIEVISGASSTLYGSNAVGGVVNLVTESNTPLMKFRAGAGSWGHRKMSIYTAGTLNGASGMLSADFLRSVGDFRYPNKGLSPARSVVREGADQRRESILGSLGWKSSSIKIRLSGFYNHAERGIPTINSATADSARQWDNSLRIWAHTVQSWNWGILHSKSQIENVRLRYTNPRWTIDDTNRYLDASTDLSLRLINLRDWDLVTGLTGGYTTVRAPSFEGRLHEYRVAAYMSGAYRWNAITVYPSIRMDGYQKTKRTWAFTPRLGLNTSLNSSSTLHLKGSVGRAFRMPTFNDRFYQPGGNRSLRPEKGWSYDTGVLWSLPMFEAELTAFWLRMTDQIIWQPVENEFFWSPANIQNVINRGLEASLKLENTLSQSIRVNHSFLWTMTDSRGTGEARLVPRHQIKAFSDLKWDRIAIQIGARYSGVQLISDETQKNGVRELDSIFLANAQVRLHLSVVTLRVQLNNLLDKHYEYVPGYPMPPRSVRIDLNLTFK